MTDTEKVSELCPGEILTLLIEYEPVGGAMRLGGTAASFTERLGMLEHALLLLKHEYAKALAIAAPRVFPVALKAPQRM